MALGTATNSRQELDLAMAVPAGPPTQQQQLHTTAQIRLTCWNADVYEPSDDSFLLVDVLEQQADRWKVQPPHCYVELGSGSGFVICSLALQLQQLGIQAHLLAIDHNLAAAQATAQTLCNHGVTGVDTVVMDMFKHLGSNMRGHIDVLVFNPPYVPTPDEEWEGAQTGVASAWAGGHRGRRVIDQLLPQLNSILSPNGELYMVTVTENQPAGILQEMEAQGFTGSIVGTRQADEETLSILRLVRASASNI